jgi:hypothetical protein
MKYLIRLLMAAFCLPGNIFMIHAQSTIPAAGGNAAGAGGTVSYSVGQVVFTTNTGTSGSVSQGVQQPYEISVITSIAEAKEIILFCSVYPNPANDFLTLKIENYDSENLSYRLIDLNGILFENKKINADETSINLSSLVPAIYFLKIFDRQKEIKTFKIIKN